MRIKLLVLVLITLPIIINAKTIFVGSSGDYPDLITAFINVKPGDTVFLMSEKHKVNQHLQNIKGEPDKWIIITSNPRNPALYEGGSTAIQLSDVSYLKISNIVFSGQTANGLNIDDGGTYESPAHHIIIENCSWLGMNATGNNDELKMSGVDNFEISLCNFDNGAAGGSLIDMVGCHQGKIFRNNFTNAGSNAIQAKGGSKDIDIYQNFFQNCGQRSVNIGGSTGLQYFRPLEAKHEAMNIRIFSNQFIGSVAPIAFVGATQCSVINNLLYMPSRWLVRILQENLSEGFVRCSFNTFANNICFFNNSANNEQGINIGSNTLPNTFDFSNNLWFNSENPNWNGPNPSLIHSNSIINQNPQLKKYDHTYIIDAASPAVAKGKKFDFVEYDYFGEKFNNPPSIGANEGNPTISGIFDFSNVIEIKNFLSFSDFKKFLASKEEGLFLLLIYNITGSEFFNGILDTQLILENMNLVNGFYIYSLFNNTNTVHKGIIINY